jgi:hypothetical protein
MTYNPTPPTAISLGDKLQATLTELEDAKIKGAQARADADLEKIRKNKQRCQTLVDGITSKIVTSIMEGKVPYIKITAYDDEKWIKAANNGKAEFQSLWKDMCSELGQENLEVVVRHAHDGVGMKSWIVITVIPRTNKVVYRGDTK